MIKLFVALAALFFELGEGDFGGKTTAVAAEE
jgi:hypothetical protein